jgi:ABC-2 type transport system permease protein
VVVQVALAVATVVGYGLLMGEVSDAAARYLCTGAATVTLVMVGLVITPQQVGQSRTEGSLDWLRTLPVPRWSFLAADVVMWTVLALPGMVLGSVVGALRFGVDFSLAPWVVLLVLAISVTAAAIGYALAMVLQPMVATLVSQLLVFVILLFSPISFPASRLPDWLAAVHEYLPFEPMGELMRAGLMSAEFGTTWRAAAVLAAWCAACLTAALWALRRRA